MNPANPLPFSLARLYVRACAGGRGERAIDNRKIARASPPIGFRGGRPYYLHIGSSVGNNEAADGVASTRL